MIKQSKDAGIFRSVDKNGALPGNLYLLSANGFEYCLAIRVSLTLKWCSRLCSKQFLKFGI